MTTLLANLINGRAAPPIGGAYLDNIEPATGQVYSRIPDSDERDVAAAAHAAKSAFPAWSATPAPDRSRLLHRLADLIDANLDTLAQAECRDNGKPVALARSVDIPRAAANFRFFADAILKPREEVYHTEPGAVQADRAINTVLRRPRGIAGCISPWNLPLYLLTWKIAPALATGNTVIGKPSEVTPLTASMLGELSVQAGLPPGVLNIIHGRGQSAGGAIVSHPDIPTITFTGSTAVGRWIGQTAGQMLKRVSLELGGKNPYLVFADADLPAAMDTAARAAFSNQGQICLCGSRFLVERAVYDQFLAGLIERAKALKIGDPADPATQFGALVSRTHLEKVDSYVKLARELGGTVHCGGAPVPAASLPERCRAGYFYPPTIITGLDPACRVEQEEIFGPVVSVTPFDSEEQAIALANGTAYGLAATFWTRDAARLARVGATLDAGIVWANCWMLRDLRTPFGGTKQSGVGREGGEEALRFFTESTNVCVRV
jgi:aminomuconate-semialdehyde/2-hydroxymuconate-6-semialdehyde dehydrogenase